MIETPWTLFVMAFMTSGLAGLAALLRSGAKLTWYSVPNSVLNGGLLGLAVTLVWYKSYAENVYALVGICILAGLGGMTTVEMITAAFRKSGLNISLGKDKVGLFGDEEDKTKEKPKNGDTK